jgi:hypothetical protein
MPRSLTAGLEAATLAASVAPIMLLEALFDASPIRLWTGLGDLIWNGYVWTGAGTLVEVSSVQETQDLRATGLEVTLNGLPPEVISLALATPYHGRIGNVYFGALDVSTGALIADPYLIFGGRVDVMTIGEGATTASIRVSIEGRLIDLEVARERRYENEDHKLDFPDDRFFEYVSVIQDAQILWGRS